MAKTITLPEKPKIVKLPRIARELVQCQMCGYCIDVCEAHRQTPWESVTARGKIYYLNQLDKRGLGQMDKLFGRKVDLSPDFVDAIYKCTGCGNCEAVCHAKIELVKLWETVRAWLVQEGVAPLPVHKGIAKKIATTGNSFGESPSDRDAWWPADVERAEVPDAIMFAGCTGSYRMQHIPAAGVKILSRAGVNLNCMGSDEVCCSSPLLRTGIRDQTMNLAMKNVTKADGVGAKDMIMTCSGCYKTVSSNFGEYYSKTGQNVYHFTQYVDKLIKERKLPFNNEFQGKVTYHDPCHLGRHSKVYEEPRNILKKIKGIEFVEMEKNRENSRCCGAGGGYKSAFNDFAVSIAAERIRDAEAVGANIIATACPFCVLNLKAGAKLIDSKVKVMDISEILLVVTGPVPEPEPEPIPMVEASELDAAKAEIDALKGELENAAASEELEAARAEAEALRNELENARAEAEALREAAAAAEEVVEEEVVEEPVEEEPIEEIIEEPVEEVVEEEPVEEEPVEEVTETPEEEFQPDPEVEFEDLEETPEEKPVEEAEPVEEFEPDPEVEFDDIGDDDDELDDGSDDWDEEDLEYNMTPEGIVRRAAWNKRLRCRRHYGIYTIPVAFVKVKVAVYVGGDPDMHREKLEADKWKVLYFDPEKVTDGEAEAEEIRLAAKEQKKALKKKKKKKTTAKKKK